MTMKLSLKNAIMSNWKNEDEELEGKAEVIQKAVAAKVPYKAGLGSL